MKKSRYEQESLLEIVTDSDWAADRESRQSVSCGAIMLNGNLIHFQSKRQKSIALSSCEAETIAATSILSEGVFLKALLTRILGKEPKMVMYSDSSSSRQLIARKGLGKARHLDVDLLWIQSIPRLIIKAIKGKDNPADLGTKSLSKDKIRKYMTSLGYVGEFVDQEEVERNVQVRRTNGNGRSGNGRRMNDERLAKIIQAVTMAVLIGMGEAKKGISHVYHDRLCDMHGLLHSISRNGFLAQASSRPVPRWAFHVYGNYKIVLGSLVGFTEDEEKNKTNGWQKVTEHETRSMVNWECDCKWHLPTDYVERFNLMMPSDMWQQVRQIMCEGIDDFQQEEKALREMVKKAVEQQDREEAERKRKEGIAELEAAEAEAVKRKKARMEREDSRGSPVSVASPVMDATMIAQIAEQVRANLSIADLERMLQEKKTSEPSRSSKVEKEHAAKEKVEKEKKDDVDGEDMD